MDQHTKKLKTHLAEHQAELDKDVAIKKTNKVLVKERTAFEKLETFTERMEFFCDRCLIEMVAPAYKIWNDLWQIGTWRSACPECSLPVYRHITSKVIDPYYEKSQKIKEMRLLATNDMLAPGQYGFKTLYGDPYEHFYDKYQKKDEAIKHKYLAMGLKGETIGERTERDKMKDAFGL